MSASFIPQAPSAGAQPPAMPRAAYVAALGFGLILVQTSAVSVALPDLREDLGANLAGLQWSINAFSLVLASLLIPAGVLSDRVGAARALVAGLWFFAAGLLLAAAAPSVSLVIAGQALAGAGGALIVPSTTAITVETTTPGAQRARAIGLLGIGAAVGFGLGPATAGGLVALVGWRGAFLLPLICAAGLLLAARRVVPASVVRPARSADARGVVLAVVAVATLIFALTDGNSHGWVRTPVFAALAVSAVATLLFGMLELRVAHPLLPARVFVAPGVRLTMIFAGVHNGAIYGSLFVVVLALPALAGVSALELGLLMVPQAISSGFAAAIAARWVARRGPALPVVCGTLIGAAGMLCFALAPADHVVVLCLIGLTLFGAGGGLVVPALTSLVTLAVPPDLTATGAAALNASRQLGGVFGVALIGGAASLADPLDALHVGGTIAAAVTLVAVLAAALRMPRRVLAGSTA